MQSEVVGKTIDALVSLEKSIPKVASAEEEYLRYQSVRLRTALQKLETSIEDDKEIHD